MDTEGEICLLLAKIKMAKDSRKPTVKLAHQKELLRLRLKLHDGKDHADVGRSYYNVGATLYFHNLGEPGEACDHLQKSLDMRQRLQRGKDHTDIAATHSRLATALQSLGKFTEAMDHHEKSIQMKLRLYGDCDHLDIAEGHSSIANTLTAMGRENDALERFKLASEMKKRLDSPPINTSQYSPVNVNGPDNDSSPNADKGFDVIDGPIPSHKPTGTPDSVRKRPPLIRRKQEIDYDTIDGYPSHHSPNTLTRDGPSNNNLPIEVPERSEDDVYQELLQKNWVMLLRKTCIDAELTGILYQNGILTETEQDKLSIESFHISRSDKVEMFLNFLKRKDPKMLPKVLDAFIETEQTYIAEQLGWKPNS